MLPSQLLVGWLAMPDVAIDQARGLVVSYWSNTERLRPQSIDKFDGLLRRFVAFADAYDVRNLADVDASLAERFIRARGRDRRGEVSDAAVGTMQVRRAVLRAFYRTARELQLTWDDPARDVELPRRAQESTRALTVDEVELIWMHAWAAGRTTRHAATVALLLSGVHTAEAGHVTAADVDFGAGTLAMSSRGKFSARSLPIAPRYLQALAVRFERLLAQQPRTAARDIVLATGAGGTDDHKQSRICTTVTEVLRRCGFSDDPTIRPSSLTAFPARVAFDATGRIDAAARLLGLSSLDGTARAIDWEWRGGR